MNNIIFILVSGILLRMSYVNEQKASVDRNNSVFQ
jgi:hypothetical protein